MKTVSIEEFTARVETYLADAATNDLILTNQGKPWLIVRAIGDREDVDSDDFAKTPAFWQMIGERRKEKGIPWEEARKQLGLEADAE